MCSCISVFCRSSIYNPSEKKEKKETNLEIRHLQQTRVVHDIHLDFALKGQVEGVASTKAKADRSEFGDAAFLEGVHNFEEGRFGGFFAVASEPFHEIEL